MKLLLLLILTSIIFPIFFSCSGGIMGLDESYEKYENYILPSNYCSWVTERIMKNAPKIIEYGSDSDIGYVDYWQTPEESLSRGAGDCEDIAILHMVLWYRMFKEKGFIYILKSDDGCHAIFGVIRDGKTYLVTQSSSEYTLETYNKFYGYRIISVINYSQALYIAFEVKDPSIRS